MPMNAQRWTNCLCDTVTFKRRETARDDVPGRAIISFVTPSGEEHVIPVRLNHQFRVAEVPLWIRGRMPAELSADLKQRIKDAIDEKLKRQRVAWTMGRV